MLKIRDDVDLKELQKFGYEKISLLNGNQAYKKGQIYIGLFYSKKRVIYSGLFSDEDFDILFDLIQAGLVEKVEEERWK